MHLDFKLQNAILVPQNSDKSPWVVKLIDFGAARKTNSDKNIDDISTSIHVGRDKVFTPKYAAPELLLADQVFFSCMSTFKINLIFNK
jgi:serine/threonine protein kinase